MMAEIALPAPGRWPGRYNMIDAWRGAASLAVVGFHVAGFPFGDIAVYLFFVISGYCIAASAMSSIDRKRSFGDFMKRRVRRIYPPYFASFVFFVITRLVKWRVSGENTLASHTLVQWIQNLTLTQWLTMLFHPSPWSGNRAIWVAAHWSLNYEEQFYLLTALLIPLSIGRPGTFKRVVLGVIICSVAWNLWVAPPVRGLFIEFFALFGIGSLVYFRLCRQDSAPKRRAFDVLMIVVAAATALIVWRVPMSLDMTAFVRTMLVGSIFAVVLVALRPLDRAFERSYIGLPLMALGAISYSLYLVHQFNMVIVNQIAAKITRHPADTAITIVAAMIGHLIIATIFWFFFERPFVNRSGRQSPLLRDRKGDVVVPHTGST